MIPTPRTLGVAAFALGLSAAAQTWMLGQGWPGVIPALSLIAGWLALVLAAQPLWARLHRAEEPPAADDAGRTRSVLRRLLPAAFFRRLVRPLATGAFVLLALVCARLAWRLLSSSATGLPAGPALVVDPRVHVIGLALLFLLFFLRQFLVLAVEPGAPVRRSIAPELHLVIGLLALQSLVGLIAPVFPAAGLPGLAARLVAVGALYLPLEAVVALALRILQTRRRRSAVPFSGLSLALSALLGGRSPLGILAHALQDSLGLEIRGTWFSRALRAWAEPLALLLVLVLWLSSAIVIVPLGSEAVRMRWGRFQPESLGPGLHFIAPWPVERARLVPVARVDGFALGYEKDLGGALLWAEPHFAGERNLLVGDGEQALTFNVPVQFSRPDALAVERSGPALPALLANLAYRELLLATAPRDAFAIMTTDRAAIAADLHTRLQSAADRLVLGARIHHVGLKDIHPPVEVAPAYQEVISAREQRRMMVDLARANRLTSLAQARGDDFRARGAADGAAAERLATVTGEAARLGGKVDAWLAAPELFDLQSRLALAEQIVPRVRLFLVRGEAGSPAPMTLDYRESGGPVP
jgi:regulator of protease activity HflC (stomatin/prohibitin superfamily)